MKHVPNYGVYIALSNAPNGMTFVNFIRGDPVEAERDLTSMFRKKTTRPSRNVNVAAEADNPVTIHVPEEAEERYIRLICVKVYRTEAGDLLDSGASPNILSEEIVKTFSLTPL